MHIYARKLGPVSLRLLAIIIVVVLAGALLLDKFQGRMLGAMVGTTTDPRTALGERSFRASMKPRLFTLRDRTYRPFFDGLVGNRKPKQYGKRISFAIPEAFLYRVRSEPDGWSRRTTGVLIRVSSQNFKPYRTEWFPVRKEVAKDLEIDLVSPDQLELHRVKARDRRARWKEHQERRIRDKSYPFNGLKRTRYRPPDLYSARRINDELVRRGFAEVFIGIGVTPRLNKTARESRMLVSVFGNRENYETSKGCTQSPGPWPNSTRYELSRSVLQALGHRRLRHEACFRPRSPKSTYAIVQRDANGQIEFIVRCAYNSPSRFKSCKSLFFWKGIWPMSLNVTDAFENRIPEFIAKARALFDGFEVEAKRAAGHV